VSSSKGGATKEVDEAKFLEAYHEFLEYHRGLTTILSKAWLGREEKAQSFPMFRVVDKTGVIFATSLAKERGFNQNDPTWANMGQGAPETGPIDGGKLMIDVSSTRVCGRMPLSPINFSQRLFTFSSSTKTL